MAGACCSRVLLLVALLDIAVTDISNSTTETKSTLNVEAINKKLESAARSNVTVVEPDFKKTRRKHRSTSSSSGENSAVSGSGSDESLKISISSDSSDSDSGSNKSYRPQSSKERHGWRKWHRKCQGCPEEQSKKWKDQTINWICGTYQRARRSFKSDCMMHFRNCQDGTMFVKISDHRCDNDTKNAAVRRGEHFFYDYEVRLSDDTSSDTNSDSSSSMEESSDYI